MSKPIAALFIVLVFISSATAYAGGRAYINGKLVEEKPKPKVKLKEGDFIINKKGLKHDVLLELGWGDGDYEVGLLDGDMKSGPQSIAVDNNGNIYICDTFNERVLVYNPAGKYIRQFNDSGGNMIAVGDDGEICTYGAGSGVLFEYTSDGVLVRFVDIPRMATKALPNNIIIADGDIYLTSGTGYQKINRVDEYTDSYGYTRLKAVLDDYIEDAPASEDYYIKDKKMSEIEPLYESMGIGSSIGIIYNRALYKIRPRVFVNNATGGKLILYVPNDKSLDAVTSIVLYNNCVDFDTTWDELLYVDKKGNIYQLQICDEGAKVVAWRLN